MFRHFEEELDALKKRLLHMGDLVARMIADAVRILIERKNGFADGVRKDEIEVNTIQMEIDDRCLTLLALQQPAAADLRFITSAMKIASDLERMADQAINIAESSLKLLDLATNPAMVAKIEEMSLAVKGTVKSALDSFVGKDVDMAKSVLLGDDSIDSMKDELFRDLLRCMIDEPSGAQFSLGLILISRNLERIGDHATNICEDVIFMVRGKDIRHHVEDIDIR